MHVQPSEPLVDAHIFYLVINIEQASSIFDGKIRALSMLKEVTLELGHVDLELRELVGECLLLVWRGVREKLAEETLHLLLTCIIKLNMNVSSAWSQESRIQLLSVISGHHEDAPLLRADTVKSIQEA